MTAALTAGCLTACGESASEPDPSAFASVTTVLVIAPSTSIFRSDTLRLTASVKNQQGLELSGKKITWTSSNPLVATIDSVGRLVGIAAGQVSVTAAVEGKSGTAQITVVGPGTEGAVAGSVVLGTAGGAVNATLPGGGQLALSVPSGALGAPVEVSLQPMVPGPGSQASFVVSPAGLKLNEPATITIKVSPGARVRPTTVLVFGRGGQRIPVPSVANPAQGTVTATLTSLGISDAAQPGGQQLRFPGGPAAAFGGEGSLLDLTPEMILDDAEAALRQLKQLGTPQAADAMLLSMQAVLQAGAITGARFQALQADWRATVCAAEDFAVNAMNNFGFASDYRGLGRVIGAVLAWDRAERDMTEVLTSAGTVGCLGPALDAESLIGNKLNAMQAVIRNDLTGFAVDPTPRDSVFLIDRLSPLLDLAVFLQQAAFDDAADLLVELVSGQFVRLRFIGYNECRGGRPQTIQGRLMRLEASGGVFSSASPYEVADIESDIELCGMDIRWRLLDSAGAPTQEGRLGGGNNPGNTTLTGTGSISGQGGLEIQGTLNALRCPAPASANSEQLEVLVGTSLQSLSRVGILTPSNQNTYLAVSPLHITFSTIRNATGTALDGAGQARVVIRRVGGICSGQFVNLDHSPLGTLTLDMEPPEECPALRSGSSTAGFLITGGTRYVCAPSLAIVTVTLPGATVGSSYSSTLQASGGSGSYQWSIAAGQLPPGLSLAAGGAITGTPATAGTFNFTVQVVSGTGNIQRALTISVTQPSALLVWPFDADLEGWSCSSTNACKWQLLTSDQFPQTSGWVALQGIGEAVSRNIALPSNARFLRFDASTHNVPGDVSRVAVQVGGVTVLDTVFTNPGSNTAFNFVTMTIDISARAGQTVNIRFVQLDDGQGNPTTLKIDNISISPN